MTYGEREAVDEAKRAPLVAGVALLSALWAACGLWRQWRQWRRSQQLKGSTRIGPVTETEPGEMQKLMYQGTLALEYTHDEEQKVGLNIAPDALGMQHETSQQAPPAPHPHQPPPPVPLHPPPPLQSSALPHRQHENVAADPQHPASQHAAYSAHEDPQPLAIKLLPSTDEAVCLGPGRSGLYAKPSIGNRHEEYGYAEDDVASSVLDDATLDDEEDDELPVFPQPARNKRAGTRGARPKKSRGPQLKLDDRGGRAGTTGPRWKGF